MDRKRSANVGALIGTVAGMAVAVVVGLAFAAFAPKNPGGPDTYINFVAPGFLVVAGTLCGAIVGFLLGERPRKPRDPDATHPPAD